MCRRQGVACGCFLGLEVSPPTLSVGEAVVQRLVWSLGSELLRGRILSHFASIRLTVLQSNPDPVIQLKREP